jgi:hypothetical protein
MENAGDLKSEHCLEKLKVKSNPRQETYEHMLGVWPRGAYQLVTFITFC